MNFGKYRKEYEKRGIGGRDAEYYTYINTSGATGRDVILSYRFAGEDNLFNHQVNTSEIDLDTIEKYDFYIDNYGLAEIHIGIDGNIIKSFYDLDVLYYYVFNEHTHFKINENYEGFPFEDIRATYVENVGD